jgi:hypothetical protein
MAIVVKSNLNYGQIVFIKTDTHQDPRQVIGIEGTADGGLLIKLSMDGEVGWFYECEISIDKDVMLATSN